MKVAFVSGNREQLPDAVIPIGLLYVLESCAPSHETVLWDLCFEADPQQTLARKVADFDPDVVAIGMRNVQNNDYGGVGDNVVYYRGLVETVRSHGRATVVLGGGGFSVMPAALMQQLRPDFGVAGEGEQVFPRLLRAMGEGGVDGASLPGVYRWQDGALVEHPPDGAFLDIDGLRPPDRRRVDRRYYERFGIESVQTKRGCSLRCEYCTYPTIEGRRVRRRSPARVVDELLAVTGDERRARHVFIVDSVFNLPPEHAKAICREMIDRRFAVPWTCYANPIGFDEELAALMAEAGCTGVEIGSDSGCDDVLQSLKKGFDIEAIRRMHERCRAAGIKDCHSFMLGTPGESLEHVRRTLRFIAELEPFCAIMMTWVDDHEAVEPDRAAERAELRRAVDRLLREAAPQQPRWIMPSLQVNFDHKLFAVLRRMGLSGPLWQHIDLAEARRRRFGGLR